MVTQGSLCGHMLFSGTWMKMPIYTNDWKKPNISSAALSKDGRESHFLFLWSDNGLR